jgi:hypothetical protein
MVVAFMVVTLSKLVPVYFGAIKLSHKGEKAAIHFIWWAYRKLIVLLVLLFLVTAWFSFNFSRKILILTAAIFKYNGGEQVLGLWPSLFYYPKAIITQASFSPWLGLLLLISIFLPFVMSRFVEVHHLFIIVWTVLLLLTAVVPAKSGQLVYIILPFIFIIFSTGLFYIKEKLQDKNPKLVFWLLLLVFVPALFSLPQLANLWFPSYPGATMQQVIGFYKESTPQDTIMVIPLNLLRLNPEVVEFYLSDRKGAIITDTSQIGPKVEGKKKYFLTLEIDDNSKYKTETLDDSLLLWNQALQQKLEQGQIKLFLTRRFDNIGISAMIYEEI